MRDNFLSSKSVLEYFYKKKTFKGSIVKINSSTEGNLYSTAISRQKTFKSFSDGTYLKDFFSESRSSSAFFKKKKVSKRSPTESKLLYKNEFKQLSKKRIL